MRNNLKAMVCSTSALFFFASGCDVESQQQKSQIKKQTANLESEDNYSAMALAELDGLLKEKEESLVLPEEIENEDVFKNLKESLATAFKKMDQQKIKSRLDSAVALLDSDKDGKVSKEELASGIKNILGKFQEFAPKYKEKINKGILSEEVRCFFVNGKLKDSANEEIRVIIHKSSIAKCGFPEVLAPGEPFENASFCAKVLEKKSKNELLKAQREDMLWSLGSLPDDSCNERIRPDPEGSQGGYQINNCAPERIRLALRNRFVKMCENIQSAGNEPPDGNISPMVAHNAEIEINKLVEGPQRCDTKDDCKVVALGVCGGNFIYYSVKSVDEKILLDKFDQIKRYNEVLIQTAKCSLDLQKPEIQFCGSDKICTPAKIK